MAASNPDEELKTNVSADKTTKGQTTVRNKAYE